MMTSRTLESMAVFGGRPAFAEPLHVGRPNIGKREELLRRFGEALDRRWLTNDGALLQEFEARVAEFLSVTHCVAVCNGTMALAIAARAAGLDREVIVPSFTFVATAHALAWNGATPIFCDVDLATHHLDPTAVEKSITPRTSGILGLHTWGRPCDVDALIAIGQRHNLPVLFDASAAFGCTYNGSMVGRHGAAEALSFHATKVVNTFEGGAIVTNDDQIAEQARLMRNYGFAGSDEVVSLGINAKMNEASAAMGLTSLESFDSFKEAGRRNYLRYEQGLSGLPGVRFLQYDLREQNNFHNIVLEVDAAASGIDRDGVHRVLSAENVLARRYFFPGCHRMEPYRSRPAALRPALPNTERLAARVMSLPTGTQVGEADVDVCEILRLTIENGEQISTRLDLESAS